MDKESPILARIFKEESEMEVWKQTRDGRYALLKTYPICRWSGALGPKRKEGDRQAPEGFYAITPGQMNPNSSYYLAFNTGFPNAYDRAWDRTGSELMVHGDCSSSGCFAMTDQQMQEIYALARESFFGGQKAFQLQAFPFRMTALKMAKHRNNPDFAFWKMLKQGYDHFNATQREPKVAVCEKRYVFDAVAPENASQPLSFNARGKCPVYQIDPAIADAVLEHRRQEQYKMAEYIANGVSTVPLQKGVDGGMNPVFAAKLGGAADGYDVAGDSAPGALPRGAPTRSLAATPAEAKPVLASVSTPAASPKKENAPAKRSAIANLIGNLFSGQAEENAPASAEANGGDPVALRGSKSEIAAKSRRTAPAAPKAVVRNVPQPDPKPAAIPQVKEADAQSKPTEAAPVPQMRSAFSGTPRTTSSGMLAGAQPVVPTGTFDGRWSGLR